jgi:hypothetical protein
VHPFDDAAERVAERQLVLVHVRRKRQKDLQTHGRLAAAEDAPELLVQVLQAFLAFRVRRPLAQGGPDERQRSGTRENLPRGTLSPRIQ